MAVYGVFMDEIDEIRALRYIWSEDGSMLLALDCQRSLRSQPLTFAELLQTLEALCCWQLRERVMVGFRHAVVDVMTLYHAFEFTRSTGDTLMLISTPPDEYFEPLAA